MLSFQPHIFSTMRPNRTLYTKQKYNFLSNQKKIWNEILKSLKLVKLHWHRGITIFWLYYKNVTKREHYSESSETGSRGVCGFLFFLYKLSVTSIIEWGENAELVKPLPPGMQNRPQRTITGTTRPEASCNTSPGAHTRETHGAGTL